MNGKQKGPMKNKLKFLALSTLIVAACARDGVRKAAQEPQYDVVQEGAASGVTSTIHGPGETLPPMTSTNADTTSSFTLDPTLAAGGPNGPATIAGTLPQQPYGGTVYPGGVPRPATTGQPMQRRPVTPPDSNAGQPTNVAQTPQQASGETMPAQPLPADPAPTTSTGQPAQPPATETTATQQPPQQATPPAEKPKQEEKPPESEDEPAEETEPAPPPPPAGV